MNNLKTKWLMSLVVIALMLTTVSVVKAQSNVAVTLTVGGSEITVGDVIPLTLRVTHPAGWRVIVPTLEKQWGEFDLRSQSTPVIVANGDGTETTSQKIEVARLRPGEVRTQAFTLSVADDQGNLQEVAVAPVDVMVQSVLVAGDTQLRDIKPQVDLITSQRTLAPILVALALGLVALGVYGAKSRRNRPAVDNRTPRERALDTLHELEVRHLQAPEDLTVACVDIAICLREYVATTTPTPARDLTTSELAYQLMRQQEACNFPQNWNERVVEVLRVCDSVKFARDVLELTTIQGLLDTVEVLVNQYPPAPVKGAA